jgi:hypothetical protein
MLRTIRTILPSMPLSARRSRDFAASSSSYNRDLVVGGIKLTYFHMPPPRVKFIPFATWRLRETLQPVGEAPLTISTEHNASFITRSAVPPTTICSSAVAPFAPNTSRSAAQSRA